MKEKDERYESPFISFPAGKGKQEAIFCLHENLNEKVKKN